MKRLPRKLVSLFPLLACLVPVAGCLLEFALYHSIIGSYRAERLREIRIAAEQEAALVRELLANHIEPVRIDGLFRKERKERWRQSLIDDRGKLLADSDVPEEDRTIYLNRREVRRALEGKSCFHIRYSVSAGEDAFFYAVPLTVDGRRFVYRTAVPESRFAALPGALRMFLILGLSTPVLLILLSGSYFYIRYYRPLKRLLNYARLIAHSKLNAPQEEFAPGLVAEFSTELESIVGQMRRLVDSLHRLEFFRRDFIANISHEVKTPITTILASVENLKLCHAADSEAGRECMVSLERQAKRLSLLIQDILNLADLEEMQENDRKVFFPLEAGLLLEEAQMDHAAMAEKAGIILETGPCDKTEIMGSSVLLLQALSNLIINAIRYSETPRIELGAVRSGNEVRITVRDFGVGIPDEHHERIFERFYRIDKARSRNLGGTGLGLAIVKHIVQLHDGTIVCENTVPRGCTFVITLPLIS